MFSLVQKRRWYFSLSAFFIALGVVAMVYSAISFGSPLRLSIDFTSGSLLELHFPDPVSLGKVREIIAENGFADATVQTVGDKRTVSIRTEPMDINTKKALQNRLEETLGKPTELRFESVGPTIGRETTRAAVLAILAASVAILFFITIAFRKVPNAFRYGVCAIAKMFHDVLILLGVASVLGLAIGWEVDSLFLTAMVTVVGFSVQDVIVVFDRIRENIRRRRGEPFETIVNRSLLETLHRSLATQLNAIFIMVAIILFGGITIRQFMVVMLIGMVTGTYSSLFFAVPLLVAWEEGEIGALFGRSGGERAAA
ncbi:MAG: protein translocase subunit SecF [Chloroflexota bacterium]|nr:protein translocase subunit SecF [Chloroflexota bacterium]